MDCLVVAESTQASIALCGISLFERSLRTLEACGMTRAFVLCDNPEKLNGPHRAQIDLVFSEPPCDGRLRLALRGDSVFDQRLLRALTAQEKATVLIDSAVAGTPCGAAFLATDAITFSNFDDLLREAWERGELAPLDVAKQPSFQPDMHRSVRPYWLATPNKSGEKVILAAAQKGTLDIPALVHAPIETFLVSKLCRTNITPNQLTMFCNIVAWAATILFATGHLAAGAAIAVVVGVLDGLDGKLARVKLETSKAGEWEHFFDVLFEYSWWIAIAYALFASGKLPSAFSYLGLLIGAEICTALARGSVARAYGKSLCDLGLFDRIVRLVGGRRNIYAWIFALGILAGAPASAFRIIAWWGV
ncbi:MAG: CDP-alcohol phosphatidyltransferase family protein, partial [Bryobacteraceae bacterium]